MTRPRTQIDDDARAAAQAVRAAGRPLRLVEIADVLRRQGRPQTDKQACVTAERARELGLLHRRGAFLWDAADPTESVPFRPPADERSAPPELLIYCARRMLELPPSSAVSRAAAALLDEAAGLLPSVGDGAPRFRPAGDAVTEPDAESRASQSNGASSDVSREIEVLVPPVAR